MLKTWLVTQAGRTVKIMIKNKEYLMVVQSFVAGFSLFVAGHASAVTTMLSPDVYQVSGSTSFAIGNTGASDFVFSWSDSSGSYSDSDSTFVLVVGQTYNFTRTTSSHPFAITDDSLPVSGSDGSFNRTTFSSVEIMAATLDPIADFTATPSGGSTITWTPEASDIGDYFYTCTVTGHPGMTGAIQVIPEPSGILLISLGAIGGLAMRRRK